MFKAILLSKNMKFNNNTLEIKNLFFEWKEKKNFFINLKDLKLKKREKILILGESGSGKSTLLNIISGIIKPNSGVIKINQTNITDLPPKKRDYFRASNIGVIFQQFNLLDYISPINNILLPCYFTGFKKKNHKYFYEKAFHLADKLGIKKNILTQNKSKELSVGQKQRIAIIRAIINTPQLILADEPTSALDNKNKIKFIELLFEVCEQEKTTLLMVSHDTSLVKHFDDNYLLENLNKSL